FAIPAVKTGDDLAVMALLADFHPALDWRTRFKTVTITKLDKVGEEEVYVVEKTAQKGKATLKDYVSTRTFLVLKRDMPDGSSETYSDYRDVDGVKLPFKTVQTEAGTGNVITIVKEVK